MELFLTKHEAYAFVAGQGGLVQWSHAIVVLNVRVSLGVDQDVDGAPLAMPRRIV